MPPHHVPGIGECGRAPNSMSYVTTADRSAHTDNNPPLTRLRFTPRGQLRFSGSLLAFGQRRAASRSGARTPRRLLH
jgi:hypothetical protein